MNPKKNRKMNNTVVYLSKGDKEISALLKRRAVEDYFGNAILDITPKGKPIVIEPKGFGISVSHSGNVTAVVIAPCEIGIDVQERVERNNTRLETFFHESERRLDFYDLWVKKEALGKLTGDGIFVQKGKKLDNNLFFTDISSEISSFAGKDFSAAICFERKLTESINFIKLDLQ